MQTLRQKRMVGRLMARKKYIRPEKRLKKYKDFGITMKSTDFTKVKWTRFIIVVPSEADRKELQAAFEYLHDRRDIDTEFVTVNQIVHEYDYGGEFTRIMVDPKLYKSIRPRMRLSAKE